MREQNRQVHVRYVNLLYTSKTSYMFRSPSLAIFREVLYEGYVTNVYIQNSKFLHIWFKMLQYSLYFIYMG